MLRVFIRSKRHTKTTLLLACAAIGLSRAEVFACINTYGTDLEGNSKHTMEGTPEDYIRELTSHSDKKWHTGWEEQYRELLRKSKTKPSIETRNDLAAAMMHLGKIKQALAILQDIEKKHPGKYRTATNLGTAYELNGDNLNALRWIKEGIKRNTESHGGSEWLHVRILQVKLALEKNPQWLRSHWVLGMDFGSDDKPQMPSHLPLNNIGKPVSAQAVTMALQYQLTERLEFTKRPDVLVANLLFDLGNLLALTTSIEHARAVYDLSLSYEPTQANLVKRRIATANSISRNAAIAYWLPYVMPVLVVGLGLYILRRLKAAR